MEPGSIRSMLALSFFLFFLLAGCGASSSPQSGQESSPATGGTQTAATAASSSVTPSAGPQIVRIGDPGAPTGQAAPQMPPPMLGADGQPLQPSPANGSDTPKFCRSFGHCMGDYVCSLSNGACQIRSFSPDTPPHLYYLYPEAAGAGDMVIIDGQTIFQNVFDGTQAVKVFINNVQAPRAGMLAEETRIAFPAPEGASGSVRIENTLGFRDERSFQLKAAPPGVLGCTAMSPVATGATPESTWDAGPHAAAFLDILGEHQSRIYYPAGCGGLRRAASPGSYPLVVILRGETSMYLNYANIGEFLATWGFISVAPHAKDVRTIEAGLALLRGTKNLGVLHPALVNTSVIPSIAIVCHGEGCRRAEELMAYPDLKKATVASMYLGPIGANKKAAGRFVLFLATEDRRSRLKDSLPLYERQPSPKMKVIIRGGNHSYYTDNRIWYGFNGDFDAAVTRNQQYSIVNSFIIAAMQESFGLVQPFKNFLKEPPESPMFAFDSAW